jgi:hypothetical protein
MISSTGTGIDAVLDSNFPDVNSMATFTSNIITPVGPTPVTANIGGASGNGGLISTQTVAVGDVARIGYDAGYCCRSEHALSIVDTSTGAIYTAGDTYYAGWAPNVPSAYNTNTCTVTSCQFTDGSWSTGWSTAQSNIPNSGVLPAGTYEIYMWDTYGDGSDGATLVWQTIAASAGFSSAPAGPYESNLFNGRSNSNTAYQSQSYVIDLANSNSPVMGTNSGFGGVSIGGASGEFNLVCVTTAGHVMFMDGADPACTPNAVESSAGGQWQGFALGAGNTNFQYQGNGMLWQIRDIQPDPDNLAPVFDGGEIGDSHALDRTITVVIGDTGVYDAGLDVSPVPGVGPTMVYTVTSADGSTTSNTLAMTPSGDRNACAELDCAWEVDIASLQRGDSVSYSMSARDTYPLGANVHTTPTYTFDVGNPTNSLVIEWFEFSDDNSATTEDCSMQVVMYDETMNLSITMMIIVMFMKM